MLAAVLLGLIAIAPSLVPIAAATAAPSSKQLALTTLFTTMDVPQNVSGADSVPIGPSVIGTFRAAMAFTPTVSGQAKLLSIRGRCAFAAAGDLACANVGQVSIQADAGGVPSGVDLGTMGFYLLESAEGAWRINMVGQPTGGSFRLRYTEDGQSVTSVPIPWDAWHRDPRPDLPARFDNLQTVLRFAPIGGSLLTNGRFPDDTAILSSAGPGTLEAVDIALTGGSNPTVSVTQPVIEQECGVLSPSPQLTAGTKYWAVMSADHPVGWDAWTDQTTNVLESIDNAPWEPAFNPKTLALRIDAGSDTCQPVAEVNPSSGTPIGEMYVHSGAQTFNTITITNRGVSPLTLGGASFSGPDANVFSLNDLEPGPLARPFRFPRTIGIDTTSILYVTCTGPAEERWYRASLNIRTGDPDNPEVAYPVECLVDNTPPTVSFSIGEPDGLAGWWKTSPVRVGVIASDPESENRVIRVFCSSDATLDPPAVFAGAMSTLVSGEGSHSISCAATDLARNTSGGFGTELKIDSRPPVVTATQQPPPNSDGWNNESTRVTFSCDDPTPGSGVNIPASGGGLVTDETAGVDLTSSGCIDVAGHFGDPVTATVRIDMTRPAISDVTVSPSPNAAGWNNTEPTVSFTCTDSGTVQSGVKRSPTDVLVTEETGGTVINASAADCVDFAGNEAASGASQPIKLDLTDPSTQIDSGPPAQTAETTATLTFSGDDALSGVTGFACRLDSEPFEPCSEAGVTYDDLADGTHTAEVRSEDAAGNVDSTPATRTWVVDTVAPDTAIESSPDPVTAAIAASFTYTGDALGGTAVTQYECRLDGEAFAPCAGGGIDYSGLAGGNHTFEVRAVDSVGNVDPTPATLSWTIDLFAPTTTITDGPDALTLETTATFEFTSVDTGGSSIAGAECRVDDEPFTACSSPVSYSDLEGGDHSFDVRATDQVGNAEDPPATRSWTIVDVFAEDDEAETLEDTAVTVDVIDNDLVPDGSVTVTPVNPTSEQGGTITSVGDGSLRYEPPANFSGTDTFTYQVSSDTSTTEPATVTITVGPVNDAPTFTADDSVAVDEDSGTYSTAWATAMSAGPDDEVGQQLAFEVGPPSDPSLFAALPQLSPTGVLTFTPAPNANGEATIDVRLTDDGGTADGGTDTSQPFELTINVAPIDDAPTIQLGRTFTAYSSTARLSVQVADIDSPLSALAVSFTSTNPGIDISARGLGADRRVRIAGLASQMQEKVTFAVSDGTQTSETSLSLVVGGRDRDRLAGTNGPDLLIGARGRDVLIGRAGDDLIGAGSWADVIRGGAGDDIVRGLDGRDLIKGQRGDDVLRGGNRSDRIFGGSGDDLLRGGTGVDVLRGGPGNNTIIDDPAR